MKAFSQERLKVIDVIYDNDADTYVNKADGKTVTDRIKLLSEIDWEQRLYEIAKDVLSGTAANYYFSDKQEAAKRAVAVAHELIEALQKK